jgi:hypothetical protein
MVKVETTAISETYGELKRLDETTQEKLMQFMMQFDRHISFKTDLPNPMPIVKLEVLAKYFKQDKMPTSAKIIEWLIEIYKCDMVSHKRMGRKEIFETIKARLEQKEHGLAERLLGIKKE